MTPAVFLDRDDTLIECSDLPPPPPPAKRGDLVDPALVRLLPGVADGLSRIAAAGFRLVVISNQGVVARGGATLEQVEAVNARLRNVLLTEAGVTLDAVYFCPFHPQGVVPRFTREHPWRKPAPGMLLAAATELQLDLGASWLIGDAPRDVEAGVSAGLARERCLLVGENGDVPDAGAAADVVLAAHNIGAIVAQGGEVVSVLMHAAEPTSLQDPRVRATVIATAKAIGERAGLIVLYAGVDGDSLVVTLGGDRLTGLGLLAEVRRATDRWHTARTGSPLWRGGNE